MDLDAQRKAAGEQAAQLVQDGMVIGYGTGRAATEALEALARRKVRVRGVPTSQKTVQTCQRLGLPLVALEDHPRLDLVIDGADGGDPRAQLIKGGGGAARRAGPLSDSGGVLVDAPLPAGADLREVARTLKAITGVVDHGLFLDFAPTVIVGGPSGARVISGG